MPPAMRLGFACTLLAVVAPWVDLVTVDLLADHVKAGYPTFTQAQVDEAVNTYLLLLTAVGATGVVSWIVAMRGQSAGRTWVPAFCTVAWLAGLVLGLTGLLVRDTSGDTGLPTLIGLLGVLPTVPGLAALVAVWRELLVRPS